MSSERSVLQRFNLLKERVLRWERIAGLYILEAVEVPTDAGHGAERDRFLCGFASGLGFSAPDVEGVEWVNAEVFREEARKHITKALVGGADIGHSRWDVPPADAEAIADDFLALFCDEARYFCDTPAAGRAQVLAPYGRHDFYDFIFGGGCVAMDGRTAAVFWVLDND
jgi:hypothetical protein